MKGKNLLEVLLFCFILSACSSRLEKLPTDDILFSGYSSEQGRCNKNLYSASIGNPSGLIVNAIQPEADFLEWSPDGNWLLMIHDGFEELSIVKANTGERIYKVFEGLIFDASWAPDSQKIAFTRSTKEELGIHIIDIACVQNGENCNPPMIYVHPGQSVDWSNDGNYLAFEWNETEELPVYPYSSIYVQPIVGTSSPHKISGGLENCQDPDWSPINNKLAFMCQGGIYISSIDGTSVMNLTNALPTIWDSYPRWFNDGEKIAFISNRIADAHYVGSCDKVSNGIYSININDRSVTPLFVPKDISIDWFDWIPE